MVKLSKERTISHFGLSIKTALIFTEFQSDFGRSIANLDIRTQTELSWS
jgi:hypothetical protein